MDEYFKIRYTIGNGANRVRSVIASGNNEDVAMAKFLIALTDCLPSILSVERIAKSDNAATAVPHSKLESARFASPMLFAS
jgi:hypothetical protein